MKNFLKLINCMVKTVGAIFGMALKKETKFGQDMNKAFKSLIVLYIISNTIYYTFQIESLEIRTIVIGVEIILSILCIILFADIKLDKKTYWTL